MGSARAHLRHWRPYDDDVVGATRQAALHLWPDLLRLVDGARGERPDGSCWDFGWDRYYQRIRTLQPDAVDQRLCSDGRWRGTAATHTHTDEWSVVPHALQEVERIADWSPHLGDAALARTGRAAMTTLPAAVPRWPTHADDHVWYPAEVNNSIRPSWFYHEREDGKVATSCVGYQRITSFPPGVLEELAIDISAARSTAALAASRQ